MYCPTCGNEIPVELKYCNRCGANLTLPSTAAPMMLAPPKLVVPSIVLGFTILAGLGIIFGSATEFAKLGVHPAFIVWMVLFSSATLFGCTALLIRFLTRMMTLGREIAPPQPQPRPQFTERPTMPHLPPRMEPVPSVTENTTRTFTPVYREPADRGTR
ncbi:MAG TPA: zinc ribbon domain-containing protein [Pyrinomonadaceae bacterium]|nr:zinc ribbon domain-containing protein [Pyrinomonadaceae bacterium]